MRNPQYLYQWTDLLHVIYFLLRQGRMTRGTIPTGWMLKLLKISGRVSKQSEGENMVKMRFKTLLPWFLFSVCLMLFPNCNEKDKIVDSEEELFFAWDER